MNLGLRVLTVMAFIFMAAQVEAKHKGGKSHQGNGGNETTVELNLNEVLRNRDTIDLYERLNLSRYSGATVESVEVEVSSNNQNARLILLADGQEVDEEDADSDWLRLYPDENLKIDQNLWSLELQAVKKVWLGRVKINLSTWGNGGGQQPYPNPNPYPQPNPQPYPPQPYPQPGQDIPLVRYLNQSVQNGGWMDLVRDFNLYAYPGYRIAEVVVVAGQTSAQPGQVYMALNGQPTTQSFNIWGMGPYVLYPRNPIYIGSGLQSAVLYVQGWVYIQEVRIRLTR